MVDNASDDGTAALIAAHPSGPEVVRLATNAGYAGGIAAALALVDTPFMAWLNDDAVPEAGWLAALEDALLADESAAAAASRLVYADGSVQSVGVALTGYGHGVDLTSAREDTGQTEVFAFCGGAALLRTYALRAAGGVPGEFFCYYEDTDTAWRLRLAGWRVVPVPSAVAVHHHGASTRPGSPEFHLWNERNRLLMLLRCAPLRIAVRELGRFGVITVLLPLRRLNPAHAVPATANFHLPLRMRALAGVLHLLPATLRGRRAAGRRAIISRGAVWCRWAAG